MLRISRSTCHQFRNGTQRGTRRRPVEEITRSAKPERSRPDPIVTSGRKVAPVKANNGDALGPVVGGVVGDVATTAAAGTLGVQLGLGTTVPAALVMQTSTLALGALKTVAPWSTAQVNGSFNRLGSARLAQMSL